MKVNGANDAHHGQWRQWFRGANGTTVAVGALATIVLAPFSILALFSPMSQMVIVIRADGDY